MGAKTKQIQPETPNIVQIRDQFESPNYSVELLIPYVPNHVKNILEPCAGKGKIVNYLSKKGYNVIGRDIDIKYNWPIANFIEKEKDEDYIYDCDAIITNFPFSIKNKCVKKAISLDLPFAVLIPFDMSGFLIDIIDKYSCQCLIPRRRINYLTPSILINIYKSQLKKFIEKETKQKFKNHFSIPEELKEKYKDCVIQYKSIEECPVEILAKHSSSDFHSFWLTRYFDLPDGRMTFCDLSLDQIKTNI